MARPQHHIHMPEKIGTNRPQSLTLGKKILSGIEPDEYNHVIFVHEGK